MQISFASAKESSVSKSTEKQTEWSMKLRKSWSSNRKSFHAHLILVIVQILTSNSTKKLVSLLFSIHIMSSFIIFYANLDHCLLFRIKRENAPGGS